MTRETTNRLLLVTGLALLMVAGVALPLRVTRALQPVDVPAEQPSALRAMAVLTTVLPPSPTPTPAVTPTQTPEPTDAVTVTDTAEVTTPTDTLSPTVEPTLPLPTDTSEPPTETPPPPTMTPEPTMEATATQEPSPTDVPTPVPETSVPPTAVVVEPTPTPTIPQILEQNWPYAAGGCAVLLLLLFGLLLIAIGLRRRKPKPPPAPPPPPPSPQVPGVSGPYLESVSTAEEACRFDLDPQGTIIGRAPESDVVITQEFVGWETVSRTHARIYREGEQWLVEDNNSKNGVWVNGRRTGHNLLQDGWKLGIGGVEFVFCAGSGEAES